MATKAAKTMAARMDRIYGQRFNRVQVPMMSLTRIYQAGVTAAQAGGTDEQVGDAMAVVVAEVRTN